MDKLVLWLLFAFVIVILAIAIFCCIVVIRDLILEKEEQKKEAESVASPSSVNNVTNVTYEGVSADSPTEATAAEAKKEYASSSVQEESAPAYEDKTRVVLVRKHSAE